MNIKNIWATFTSWLSISEIQSRLIVVIVIAPIAFGFSAFLSEDGRYSFIVSLLASILALLIVEIVQSSNAKEFSVLLGISSRDSAINKFLHSLQNCVSLRSIKGHEFIDGELKRLINTTTDRLNRFPDSEVLVLDKYREREATTNAIKLTKRRLRAISYFALNYWGNDPGDQYMRMQQSLINDQNIDVSRIFIVPERHEQEYLQEIKRQSSYGIECLIVVEPVSNGETKRDCIIIDDTAVSYAVDIDHKTGFRSAVISFNEATISYYDEMWDSLLRQSLSLADWEKSVSGNT
jgi:hypothetical protein